MYNLNRRARKYGHFKKFRKSIFVSLTQARVVFENDGLI